MILGLSKRNLREEIKKGREESKEDTEEDRGGQRFYSGCDEDVSDPPKRGCSGDPGQDRDQKQVENCPK